MGGGGGDGGNMITFKKENVFGHPSLNRDDHIPGRLTILSPTADVPALLVWTPYRLMERRGTSEDVHKSAAQDAGEAAGPETSSDAFCLRVPLLEIHSIVRQLPQFFGLPRIIVNLRGGATFPPLFFHEGGVREFFSALKEQVSLTKTVNPAGDAVFLVNDCDDPLSQSLSAAMSESLSPRATSPPASAPLEHRDSLEDQPAFLRAMQQISMGVMDKFSAVRRVGSDVTSRLSDPTIVAHLRSYDNPSPVAARPTRRLPGRVTLVTPSAASDDETVHPAEQTELGDFEMLNTPKSAAAADAGPGDEAAQEEEEEEKEEEEEDGKEEGQQERQQKPRVPARRVLPHPALPEAYRGPPLTEETWISMLDDEGRVRDEALVRKMVFHGGVEPGIRHEVWKYLLGYFSFSSTYEERSVQIEKYRSDYAVLKQQWTSMFPEQKAQFSKLRERKHLIEKDVHRTDRDQSAYAGANNANLETMFDILVSYTMWNWDIGYVQGMSDLLSPILSEMRDEVHSFWCFKKLMERMGRNFHKDQVGVQTQLDELCRLLQYVDPDLYEYLEAHDAANMFFCYRWLLIHFKREYPFERVERIWEVLWSGHRGPNFHQFVALAMLEQQREAIMAHGMGFDDILCHFNTLAGTFDVDRVLTEAEDLFHYVAWNPPDGLKSLVADNGW